MDPRLPLLALTAWAACLLVGLGPGGLVPLSVVLALVGSAACVAGRARRLSAPGVRLVLAACLVGLTAGLVTWGHLERSRNNPVAELATQGAGITGDAVLTGDPRTVHGQYADQTLVRAELTAVSGRGRSYTLRAPVLLMATSWPSDLELGTRVRLAGELVSSDDPQLSALLRVCDVHNVPLATNPATAEAIVEWLSRSLAS